jgi:hypothetical protein
LPRQLIHDEIPTDDIARARGSHGPPAGWCPPARDTEGNGFSPVQSAAPSGV